VFFRGDVCFCVKNADLARPYAQVVVKNRGKIGKSCQKFAKTRRIWRDMCQLLGKISIKKCDTCAFGRAKKTQDYRHKTTCMVYNCGRLSGRLGRQNTKF
jgi:hypothetical protein